MDELFRAILGGTLGVIIAILLSIFRSLERIAKLLKETNNEKD